MNQIEVFIQRYPINTEEFSTKSKEAILKELNFFNSKQYKSMAQWFFSPRVKAYVEYRTVIFYTIRLVALSVLTVQIMRSKRPFSLSFTLPSAVLRIALLVTVAVAHYFYKRDENLYELLEKIEKLSFDDVLSDLKALVRGDYYNPKAKYFLQDRGRLLKSWLYAFEEDVSFGQSRDFCLADHIGTAMMLSAYKKVLTIKQNSDYERLRCDVYTAFSLINKRRRGGSNLSEQIFTHLMATKPLEEVKELVQQANTLPVDEES